MMADPSLSFKFLFIPLHNIKVLCKLISGFIINDRYRQKRKTSWYSNNFIYFKPRKLNSKRALLESKLIFKSPLLNSDVVPSNKPI